MGFGNCDSLLSSTWIQSCASILVLFGDFFRDKNSTTSIELEGNRPEICKNRESFFSKSYIFGSKRFLLFHVIFHEAILLYEKLGGGFKDFLFSLPGEDDPI